eukprot:gb/GECH01010679.1/.p1 GENE.gb/GECH01010679.1/~~gb/GECH01010679.1/.p1  ORF type:complete len:163 (+),score=35.10 gb/GECH01010679.1/:1-489(+)
MEESWNRDEAISFERVAPYILQLLRSIRDLQEYNIVHRSIKEDNVLYSKKHDCFVLADMGDSLQCNGEEKMQHLVYSGDQTWSHPYFIPPEVSNMTLEEGFIDYSKANLYALGITMLRILSMNSNHRNGFAGRLSQKKFQLVIILKLFFVVFYIHWKQFFWT